MGVAEIIEQIRALPPQEQHEVIEKIREEYGDFDDELTPEQIAELERRAEELRKHPERGIPWEQVRDLTAQQIAELDRRGEDALKNPGRGTPIEEVSAEIRKRLAAGK
jgi:putative addiction module component (TIGR02574 family)